MSNANQQTAFLSAGFNNVAGAFVQNMDDIFSNLQSQRPEVTSIAGAMATGIKADSFALAWAKTPAFCRKMLMREITALNSGLMGSINYQTPVSEITPEQREALTKALRATGEGMGFGAATMIVVDQFNEAYLLARSGVAS